MSRAGPTTIGRVAVIGEQSAVACYVLAGALVLPAEDEAAVVNHWTRLPDDVRVVVLTASAAASIGDERLRAGPLTVVMPR